MLSRMISRNMRGSLVLLLRDFDRELCWHLQCVCEDLFSSTKTNVVTWSHDAKPSTPNAVSVHPKCTDPCPSPPCALRASATPDPAWPSFCVSAFEPDVDPLARKRSHGVMLRVCVCVCVCVCVSCTWSQTHQDISDVTPTHRRKGGYFQKPQVGRSIMAARKCLDPGGRQALAH